MIWKYSRHMRRRLNSELNVMNMYLVVTSFCICCFFKEVYCDGWGNKCLHIDFRGKETVADHTCPKTDVCKKNFSDINR